MHYQRKLFKTLQKYIQGKEAIVLTGMRRVGKTTLYRMLFDSIESKNKVFFDLENPIEQKIFEEEDYNNIWENLKSYNVTSKERAYIFLDEIQAMPSIVFAIKYLHDHYDVKFFLTGSSSFYLKNLFPESLAGRKYIFELFPLEFEEFLIFKNKKKLFSRIFQDKDKKKNKIEYEKFIKLYEEYLRYGGFPQVVLTDNYDEKKLQLNDIFKSYFEKEVKILADFKDIRAFRDLMLLLMQRVGSKIEISKLAKEIGISRDTVYSYLSFLEGTYFIYLISPFTKNVDREVSGAKKIYLCDTGILNQFSKVAEGCVFENAVFNSLKNYKNIHYYQRRTGAEVDFILQEENVALEVKIKGNEGDYKKLRTISDDLGIKKCFVISKKFSDKKGIIPVTEL